MVCEKCRGKGYYSYDENHMAICPDCCLHDDGWWEISSHHSGYIKDGDNHCCRKGCGTMKRDLGQTDNCLP